MPNIIKHAGQLNKVFDPSNGKTYERSELLFMKLGDEITFVHPVYDDIHFIYQRHLPITEDELIRKYGGIMPQEMMGANLMCTCGAEAVYMLEGPYGGLVLCKSVAMFEKHQTSFQIKDRTIILDKQTKDKVLMTDAEMKRLLKVNEE